ncbi:MAG TPA: hypothetical protein VGB07_25200 [Blastocatellia bacterium]
MTGTANGDETLNEPDPILPEAEITSPETNYPLWLKLAGVGGLVVVLLIYAMRMNRVFGLFVDDAWYVLLAKALATGQGYSVINSPSPGILPLYPPAYPFLLSLIYRLSPQFPENIVLLKWLSVAAMMGSGVLTYWYFTRHRKLTPVVAWLIAMATMLSPTLVFLATSSLMSECVFMCVFLGAVVASERGVRLREGRQAWIFLALGAALASGAFLMRSIGLSLMAALFLYLLKVRLVKQALAVGLMMAALAGPWILYSRSRTPTPAQQQEQGGNIVQPYTQQFWQRRAGDLASGTATVKDLPARVVENILEIGGRDAARILVTPIFEALVDPAKELQNQQLQAGGQLRWLYFSFLLAILLIVGFVAAARAEFRLADLAVLFSLGITVLWPWETFRFVLPLTPFLIFYLLTSLQTIAGAVTRSAPASRLPRQVTLAAAALLVALNLYPQVNFLLKSSGQTVMDENTWEMTFNEAEQMVQQLQRTLPQDGVISSTNPAFVHLYTGHKTVSSGDASVKWEDWKKIGVRYIARVAVFTDSSSPEESGYRVVYKSRRITGFWVVDLGVPTSR